MIDEMAALAGEYFASIVALAGAAYKMEMNLARFYRRHLGGLLGGSHLPLVSGFEPPARPDAHAVVSLDWWQAAWPTSAAASNASEAARDHDRLVEARHSASCPFGRSRFVS